MLKYEDECVGCPPNMGCLGGACPYRNVPVWVCDKCGEEAEELWKYEGEELCQDCLLQTIPKAEESDHREEEDDVYDRADYEYDRWRDKE